MSVVAYTTVKVEEHTGYVVLSPSPGGYGNCVHQESLLPIRDETLFDSLDEARRSLVDDGTVEEMKRRGLNPQCILGVDENGSPCQIWIPLGFEDVIEDRLSIWHDCYHKWERMYL